MPPRGRPPTRSQSRAKATAPTAQAQPLATPEGHVQTLGDGPSEAPPPEPQPSQTLRKAPVPGTLPAPLQAVSHLLDVIESHSHGIIQQEAAAMAQIAANQQNPNGVPRSPTHTAVSRRHPHPAYDPVSTEPSEPVIWRKHHGRPPTPPSPPSSGSSPNLDGSSSVSSSSSRTRSPRG